MKKIKDRRDKIEWVRRICLEAMEKGKVLDKEKLFAVGAYKFACQERVMREIYQMLVRAGEL